ncbi:MAG: HD domain-containing phosphohydrolase [Mariprofundales bacterium]|nr:HD domain-containing phosphohydrolase [Mariprofundales bacterium]
MTDYFKLLRQHQGRDDNSSALQVEREADLTSEHDLLISEELLPPEEELPPPLLEDELLCEEESVTATPPAPTTPTTPERAAESPPPTLDSLPTIAKITSNNTDTDDEVATLIAQWLTTFVTMMHTIFQHCRQSQPVDIEPLQRHITNLIIWLERDTQLINALELELETVDLTTHTDLKHDDMLQLVMKSVMMLLYCLKTTEELKVTHETRVRLALAAVLHHIGMAQVSPDILNKTGRLSPDELAEIKGAPAKGCAYLKSCNIEDEYITRGADESNERVDGSGPRGLQGKDICYSARLIGLLSMFEAMIQVRSYRKRMLPREAIRVVVQKFKPAFERTMLKALLDAVSLYPVGSFVKLNSKEIGKVISCHPRHPLRPIVSITMDEYGESIPSRNIDLKKHPNLMIERCAYEDDIQTLLHQEKT